MLKIKKQISKLYFSSVLGNLSLTGAWVAILASRGFTLVEIGIAETIFHITSLIFEIPSGVLADVFGRKRMLIVSTAMRMTGSVIMIMSNDLFMVCLSIAFMALSYNFSSGTGDALACDSLKLVSMGDRFEKYASNQLIIYRLCSGLSTLCAGLAIAVGHKIAYGTDLILAVIQILILSSLNEVGMNDTQKNVGKRAAECFKESFAFMKKTGRVMLLMLCNSLVGAADILLLFFLQAKLPEKGALGWKLGAALLFMEIGGIAGSKLILKLPKLRYKYVFAMTLLLVAFGIFAEHSPFYWVTALGGFIAAAGDDALQVRTNALLQEMFPSEQRATLTSLESFSFSMIMIVLSPLAGFFFTFW